MVKFTTSGVGLFKFYWCYVRESHSGAKYPLDDESQYVLSLAIVPERLQTLPIVLYSVLFRNRPLVRKVFITVAREDMETVLGSVHFRRAIARGAEVLCSEDLIGAVKKLLPARERHPMDYVVTVDDDIVYSRRLLERLVLCSKTRPHAIIGANGKTIYSHRGKLSVQFRRPGATAAPNSESIWIMGGHGTVYPPKSLAPSAHNRQAIETIVRQRGSDLWFYLAAVAQGTEQHALRRSIKTEVPFTMRAKSRELPGEVEMERRFQAAIDYFGVRDTLLAKLPEWLPAELES